MLNALESVKVYFKALVDRDAETLIAMMLPVPHYVKIGTDAGEIIAGKEGFVEYYRTHVASTEDFSINFINLDVQEREDVAWFYTRQLWKLKWRGTSEEFVMRMTGVLEKIDESWKFAQIHASIGVSTV